MSMSFIQFIEDLSRTKKVLSKKELLLPDCWAVILLLSSLRLGKKQWLFLSLKPASFGPGIYMISLVLRPSPSYWNCTVTLLITSLVTTDLETSHANQPFILNLFLYIIYTSCGFCFSGER